MIDPCLYSHVNCFVSPGANGNKLLSWNVLYCDQRQFNNKVHVDNRNGFNEKRYQFYK